MKNGLKTLAMWLILGIIFILILSSVLENSETKLTYSALMSEIAKGNVNTIEIEADGTRAYVTLKDSILGLSINKDIVRMDYTIGIKDGRVYISSSNPYVKFNEIQGITIPKTKQKHWHIGPTIGTGIGTDGVIRPNIGLSLTYSIISF